MDRLTRYMEDAFVLGAAITCVAVAVVALMVNDIRKKYRKKHG